MGRTGWNAALAVVISAACIVTAVALGTDRCVSTADADRIGADPSMAHRQLVMVPSGDDTAPRDLRVSTPSTTLRLDVDRTLAPDYKPMTAFATPSLDRGDPWGAERAGTSVRARVQLDRDNPWTGRPFD